MSKHEALEAFRTFSSSLLARLWLRRLLSQWPFSLLPTASRLADNPSSVGDLPRSNFNLRGIGFFPCPPPFAQTFHDDIENRDERYRQQGGGEHSAEDYGAKRLLARSSGAGGRHERD